MNFAAYKRGIDDVNESIAVDGPQAAHDKAVCLGESRLHPDYVAGFQDGIRAYHDGERLWAGLAASE